MRTVEVPVEPALIEWAVARAHLDEVARSKLPIDEWIRGETRPTFRQLEALATASNTPIGMLFLREPPRLDLPLPDFRTVGSGVVPGASLELFHAIHLMQRRQAWFREYLQDAGHGPLDFVGSHTTAKSASQAANEVRSALSFPVLGRSADRDWNATRSRLVTAIEGMGVLVAIMGYVAANTRRVLDVKEFRGFSFADSIAPAIFVNGRDTKGGQIFTLIHELAHIYLGRSGVDNPLAGAQGLPEVELWCNQVAADVLVPRDDLLENFDADEPLEQSIQQLVWRYRASGLVVLSQLHTAGVLAWDEYREAWQRERAAALEAIASKDSDGGNYYNNAQLMAGRRFLRTILADVGRGKTTPTEAMSLLETRSLKALRGLTERHGAA